MIGPRMSAYDAEQLVQKLVLSATDYECWHGQIQHVQDGWVYRWDQRGYAVIASPEGNKTEEWVADCPPDQDVPTDCPWVKL